MKYLIDTHCWLWLQASPQRLPPDVLKLLERGSNELLLSAVSSWEIAMKYALGKLPLPEPPPVYVPSRMRISGTSGLPVAHSHALQVGELPPHNRDPFDRLLVAQAQLERLRLVTSDRALEPYDVELVPCW